MLSTPDVRAKIGVDVRDKALATSLPVPVAAKILRKIVLDLSEQRVNVNHLKSKSQQVNYISSLTEYLPNTDQMSGPQHSLRSGQAQIDDVPGAQDGIAESDARRKRAKAPPVRSTLITKDCHLTVDVPKIRSIEQELRKLPLGTYPNAISTLLRVFLELSIDHYLSSKNIPITHTNAGRVVPVKLKKKVDEALKALEELDGVPSQNLLGARTMFQSPNTPLSVVTLHGYIHNKHLGAVSDDLTTAFDNARPLFEAIWK